MARKKECEENEGNAGVQRKPHQGGTKRHNFVGGGTKKEFRHSNNSCESYDGAVSKQLSALGLTIREMPGDGNCLFRALSDQISGSSRNHLECRRAVVQYMKEFRADFEPFVEDDVPFDKHIQRLGQPGCFAGNDAIVAFARLHNVSVVIHQLNTPAWIIHPSKASQSQQQQGEREIHIFYSNGDHYNSVRRMGDDSESPANIRLSVQMASSKSSYPTSGKKSPPHGSSSHTAGAAMCYPGAEGLECRRDEDYWVKDAGDIDRLVEEIIQQTNYPDANFIRETLVDYNFDMAATIDYIISISVLLNQPEEEDVVPPAPTQVEVQRHDDDIFLESGKSVQLTHTEQVPSDAEQVTQAISLSSPPQEISPPEEPPHTPVSIQGESDDNSASGESSPSGENSEAGKSYGAKKEKLSNRRKKEGKRRDRKREGDRRKMQNASEVGDKENTVIVSHLGTLDI